MERSTTHPPPVAARRERAAAPPPRPARAGGRRLAGWFLPPLLLASTAFGVWVVLTGPAALFGWIVGALLALALGWVLVSSLFPGSADRTCPACGRDTLVRMDESTRGLVCKSCHFRDATSSSFLLAEEEGALEPELLARRRRHADQEVRIRPWTGSDPSTRSAGAAPDSGARNPR
jgi:hypothetical protein